MIERKGTVAVVANIAWHLYNFRIGLIESLEAAGYRVVLMAAPDNYVSRLEKADRPFVPLRHLQRTGMNPVKEFQLLREIRKNYKRMNVDLAIQFTSKANIYGSIAAGTLGKRAINTINGLGGPFSGNRWLARTIIQLLYRYALKHSSKVFFQNAHDRQFFIDHNMVNAEKTAVVDGSGVNIEQFNPALFSRRMDKNKFVFLLFSRLSHEKGILEYVEAATTLRSTFPDVEFQLAGPYDRDELAISEAQVQEWHKGGIVQYLGASDFIQREINQADVIVYPSFYMEGIPRAGLEALAMGKPIITTDHVGCRELVINGENGVLIPVKDASALAHAMEKMLRSSPEELEAMGKKSRQLALQRFDEMIIIGEYLKTIAALVPSDHQVELQEASTP